MDSHSIFLLVTILFCVIMSAYFSATETAFSSVNKIRLKTMAEDGNKKAARATGRRESGNRNDDGNVGEKE